MPNLKRNRHFSKKTKKRGAYGDGGVAGGIHFDIPAGTNNITFEMWGVWGVDFTKKLKIISVGIPDSVEEIGDSAFRNFPSLRDVTIPVSVTIIGKDAFGVCVSLEKIEIPNSVTEIGQNAFFGCKALASIEIPNSITEIKDSLFQGCSELNSVIIPDSVTKIGRDAFMSCIKLTQIARSNPVTEIGMAICVIPNSVTEIGTQAFRNCVSISALVIPNSVTIIERNTFNSCLALRNITIPSSVMEISTGAFSNCKQLNVDYGKLESWPQAEAGIFSRKGFNPLNKFTRTAEIHKDLGNGDSCFVRCTWAPKKTDNPQIIGLVDTTGIVSPITLTTLGSDQYEIKDGWAQIKTLLELAEEQHQSVFEGSRWCVAIEDLRGDMHEFNPSNIDLNNIAFMAIQGEIILNNPWLIVWKDAGEECGGAADGPRNNDVNYQGCKRKTRKRQSKKRQSKRRKTQKKEKIIGLAQEP